MSADFASFSAAFTRLHRALGALEPLAAAAGVAPPAGQEWFDLLRNKLLPQLDLPPLLVVAIVGGTNIGKSVIFNLLAGEVASASSPLAAGTKHPVCLCRRGTGRSGAARAAVRAVRAAAPGTRPTIRSRIRRRTACFGDLARPCRRGCCCSTRPTSIPT